MFYCRENELNKLNKRYLDKKFECVVIYGRRRVLFNKQNTKKVKKPEKGWNCPDSAGICL